MPRPCLSMNRRGVGARDARADPSALWFSIRAPAGALMLNRFVAMTRLARHGDSTILCSRLVQPVHASCGIVHDLPPRDFVQRPERVVHKFTRTWPRRGAVRVVGRPHDVVSAEMLEAVYENRVLDEGRPHLPFNVLARQQR